ncbi:hypothetical protein BZA70DRAFT_291087 [Myxozyma melibiosi]|uniref:Uncharacterized protein n=1 Tax=Myxozyma melibiosi TaxID=54550 RepID=A0ABR1F0Y0_9ASCO
MEAHSSLSLSAAAFRSKFPNVYHEIVCPGYPDLAFVTPLIIPIAFIELISPTPSSTPTRSRSRRTSSAARVNFEGLPRRPRSSCPPYNSKARFFFEDDGLCRRLCMKGNVHWTPKYSVGEPAVDRNMSAVNSPAEQPREEKNEAQKFELVETEVVNRVAKRGRRGKKKNRWTKFDIHADTPSTNKTVSSPVMSTQEFLKRQLRSTLDSINPPSSSSESDSVNTPPTEPEDDTPVPMRTLQIHMLLGSTVPNLDGGANAVAILKGAPKSSLAIESWEYSTNDVVYNLTERLVDDPETPVRWKIKAKVWLLRRRCIAYFPVPQYLRMIDILERDRYMHYDCEAIGIDILKQIDSLTLFYSDYLRGLWFRVIQGQINLKAMAIHGLKHNNLSVMNDEDFAQLLDNITRWTQHDYTDAEIAQYPLLAHESTVWRTMAVGDGWEAEVDNLPVVDATSLVQLGVWSLNDVVDHDAFQYALLTMQAGVKSL